MMKYQLSVKKLFLIFFALILSFQFLSFTSVNAQSDTDRLSEIQKQIEEAESQLNKAQSQAKTLKSQLDFIDGQTKLTKLKIDQANAQLARLQIEITSLSERITDLSGKVDTVSEVLLNRIIQTYKFGNIGLIDLLFSSHGFGDLLQSYKYIQVAQAHDKELLYRLQATKTTYNESKADKEARQLQQEKLKKDMESYQKQLTDQKKAKEELLRVTKNDEAKYQSLLAQARAEYLAIQGIVAGRGKETEIRKVSAGERIATVINGPSCNSGGAHLHFTVVQNNLALNPFNYLKPVDYENCSGSSCGSSDGDPFNPSGSWDWPLNPKITMNQGFGSTWAVRYSYVGRIYSAHNGVDIEGSSLEVKAVRSGTLFRGSYVGSAGCTLPYVRVKHDEGGLETLYLHIYY